MGTAHIRHTEDATTLVSPPLGLFSARMRPLRFISAGLLAGAVQLGLLAALLYWNWAAVPANIVAFIAATEINFVLNALFTWRDRRGALTGGRFWLTRWLRFHGAIAGTALLNQAIFLTLHLVGHWQPILASATASILVSVVNYFLGNHLVFRATPSE